MGKVQVPRSAAGGTFVRRAGVIDGVVLAGASFGIISVFAMARGGQPVAVR